MLRAASVSKTVATGSRRVLRQLEVDHGEALSRWLRTCDLIGGSIARWMKNTDYYGYRFPPEIIQQAIWLYFRFTLSFRDVEDLLAERGITVSCEIGSALGEPCSGR